MEVLIDTMTYFFPYNTNMHFFEKHCYADWYQSDGSMGSQEDCVRFFPEEKLLLNGHPERCTLNKYIEKNTFSRYFIGLYLVLCNHLRVFTNEL